MLMISLTLVAATGVRLIIVLLASARGILREELYFPSITQPESVQSGRS